MSVKIELIPVLQDNYAALIWDTESRKAVVVDPSEADPILQRLSEQNLELEMIWNTHHHWDHIGGNEELVKKTGATVYCSATDYKRVPKAQHGLRDGESILFQEISFLAMEVPGHTLGHIVFYSSQLGVVFTGDTLFSIGCGRLFEGSPEQMFESLKKLKSLPDETLVYCGHEYTAANIEFALSLDPDFPELKEYQKQVKTLRLKGLPSLPSRLATEKKLNPFLLAGSPEELKRVREQKDCFG